MQTLIPQPATATATALPIGRTGRLTALFVLVLASIVMSSCKDGSIRKDQLVGVWQMEVESRTDAKVGADVPSVNLSSDGSFVATSLPSNFAQIREGAGKRSVSGTGSWSVIDTKSGIRVLLVLKKVNGSDGLRLPYGAELSLQKSRSNIRLYYFEGDPDDQRIFYFGRVPSKGTK